MLIYTSISPLYCPTWGITEALRELIQENIDVRAVYDCWAEVYFDASRQCLVTEDDGPGIPAAALAIGNSDKRDNPNTIGQFGEGLKLACLVLARSGRGIRIETTGKTLVPVIQHHPELDCEVLAFQYTCNGRVRGTRIEVEVTQEEAAASMGLFLHLNGSTRYRVPLEPDSHRVATTSDEIFLPGGTIFIQGVLTATPDFSDDPQLLFSYNFPAKDMHTRDRWAVDWNQLLSWIRSVWTRCSNPVLIETLLSAIKNNSPFVEISTSAIPYFSCICHSENVHIWTEVARRQFAECIIVERHSGDEDLIRLARELGYQVATVSYRAYDLLAGLGVKTLEMIREDLMRCTDVLIKDLPVNQRYIYQQLTRIAKKYLFTREETAKIKIIPTTFDSAKVTGTYQSNTIRIDVRHLTDISQALSTLVHEYAHHVSRAPDCTREFENKLSDIASQMILKMAVRRVS